MGYDLPKILDPSFFGLLRHGKEIFTWLIFRVSLILMTTLKDRTKY